MEKFKYIHTLRPLAEALAINAKFWPRIPVDCGARPVGWTTSAELFADDRTVRALLDYEGSFVTGLDEKGRAAALMAEYGYLFAVSSVPLLVGHGIVPDLSSANYGIFLDALSKQDGHQSDGPAVRIRLLSSQYLAEGVPVASADRTSTPADRTALRTRFRRAVEDHFQPIVSTLHDHTALGRSALWRLVGDSLGALFLDAGQKFGRKDVAIVEAMEILKADGSPLANPQMHFFDLALHDEADPDRQPLSWTFRARGGCCRFYTAPDGKLCSTCVLLKPDERDSRLRELMRRRLQSSPALTLGQPQ